MTPHSKAAHERPARDEQTLTGLAARDFRRTHLWFLGGPLGTFVTAFVMNTACFAVLDRSLTKLEVGGIFAVGAVVSVVSTFRFRMRLCPRCQHLWNLWNGYARRCATCGLSR